LVKYLEKKEEGGGRRPPPSIKRRKSYIKVRTIKKKEGGAPQGPLPTDK
jgi:hypothetical protein